MHVLFHFEPVSAVTLFYAIVTNSEFGETSENVEN